MEYIHDTTEFYSDVPSVVTLGKFDGLHRGHQKLLQEVMRLRGQGLRSIVFMIAPEQAPVLLTEREKLAFLRERGIDQVIRCPYVPQILGMEPETFVADVLARGLHAEYVVVGTDFRFGCRRSGDAELLKTLQDRYGFRLLVLEKERFRGREISSTYTREALSRADMALVRDLLGFFYPITGTVRQGRQLGRRIGIPTINLVPDSRKLLPPSGVYFSDVTLGELRCHGVTNIGCKPTVNGSFLGVETYLYGVDADLYGREAEVRLCRFCRPERRFGSVEELRAQMERDIRAGEEYFRTAHFFAKV